MGRILVWLLLAVMAWLALRVFLARGRAQQRAPSDDAAAASPSKAPPAMLQCAYCGLHVPFAEALTGPDGRSFCSDAHRQDAVHAGPR